MYEKLRNWLARNGQSKILAVIGGANGTRYRGRGLGNGRGDTGVFTGVGDGLVFAWESLFYNLIQHFYFHVGI